MITTEPPNGSRIEFEHGTDVYAAWRDDHSSEVAGWKHGDGGDVWCLYGFTVPMSWNELNERFGDAPRTYGVRLLVHPADFAVRDAWPTQLFERTGTWPALDKS